MVLNVVVSSLLSPRVSNGTGSTWIYLKKQNSCFGSHLMILFHTKILNFATRQSVSCEVLLSFLFCARLG